MSKRLAGALCCWLRPTVGALLLAAAAVGCTGGRQAPTQGSGVL